MRSLLAALVLAVTPSAALALTADLTCNTAQASYALVPQKGASPDALLTFYASDITTGLSGTVTTAEGQNLPFDIAVSNGYSTIRAIMNLGDGFTIEPSVLAFDEGMVMLPFRPDEQAPAYILFVHAGRDAYYEQMQRPQAAVVMPPETVWKLDFCRGVT